METFLKEKEVVYDEGNHRGGNVRGRADAGLALGIVGTVLGGAALLGRGGIGAILGGGGGSPVTVNNSGGGCGTFSTYAKECDDVLALTNTIYGLKIGTLEDAKAAREIDVNEKFGLYVNNRDNIDSVNNRINSELFSLYKYTRDKDDETNAKLSEIASAVAINSAVRPYQDKLIQCEIEKNVAWLKNYFDSKMCNVVRGVNCLPLTPTVTGVIGQNCCYQFPAAAADAGTGA